MPEQNITSKIAVIIIAIMLIASSIVFWPGDSSDTQDSGVKWIENYKCALSEGINPNSIILIYTPMYCEACGAALEEAKYWENQSIAFIKIDYTNKNDTSIQKILGCYGQYIGGSVPLMFCASDPTLGFVNNIPPRETMSKFIYLCRSHADEASLEIQKSKDKQK